MKLISQHTVVSKMEGDGEDGKRKGLSKVGAAISCAKQKKTDSPQLITWINGLMWPCIVSVD